MFTKFEYNKFIFSAALLLLTLGVFVCLFFTFPINSLAKDDKGKKGKKVTQTSEKKPVNKSTVEVTNETPKKDLLLKEIENICTKTPEDCNELQLVKYVLNLDNIEGKFKSDCIDKAAIANAKDFLKSDCVPIVNEALKKFNKPDPAKTVFLDETQYKPIEEKLNSIESVILNTKLLFAIVLLLLILLIASQVWNHLKIKHITKMIDGLGSAIGATGKGTDGSIFSAIFALSESVKKYKTSQNTEGEPAESNKTDDTINKENIGDSGMPSNVGGQNVDELPTEDSSNQTPKSTTTFPVNFKELYEITDKVPLTKYPLTPNYLKDCATSEYIHFYRLTIENRFYVFPANNFISNQSEFNNYIEFYNSSGTKNGEIIIYKPAEVKWDEERKGWELIEKGMMTFKG